MIKKNKQFLKKILTKK